MSRVTAIISALVIIHRLPVGLVNHYRDNAYRRKAQRDKNARRGTNWRTQQLLTCRCVSGVAALIKIRVSLMLKLKMMLCVMMLPLVVVSYIKAVIPVSA